MAENTVSVVNQAVADPSTVGLASFGIALFTLSFLNAGLVGSNAVSDLIPLAAITALIHFYYKILYLPSHFLNFINLLNLIILINLINLNLQKLHFIIRFYKNYAEAVFWRLNAVKILESDHSDENNAR